MIKEINLIIQNIARTNKPTLHQLGYNLKNKTVLIAITKTLIIIFMPAPIHPLFHMLFASLFNSNRNSNRSTYHRVVAHADLTRKDLKRIKHIGLKKRILMPFFYKAAQIVQILFSVKAILRGQNVAEKQALTLIKLYHKTYEKSICMATC